MGRRKTHEDFVEEIQALTNGEFEVLGIYTMNKTKVKMKHVTCGYKFEITQTAS